MTTIQMSVRVRTKRVYGVNSLREGKRDVDPQRKGKRESKEVNGRQN